MKTFAIFPTLCVFVLTLTLLKLTGQTKLWIMILLTILVTTLFGGLMILFSTEAFHFLYFANFFGILVCVPCLTYLTNSLFKSRLLFIGIASTLLTIVIAGALIFFSFLNNPMDLMPREGNKKMEHE